MPNNTRPPADRAAVLDYCRSMAAEMAAMLRAVGLEREAENFERVEDPAPGPCED